LKTPPIIDVCIANDRRAAAAVSKSSQSGLDLRGTAIIDCIGISERQTLHSTGGNRSEMSARKGGKELLGHYTRVARKCCPSQKR
jgi:hypothetical protein